MALWLLPVKLYGGREAGFDLMQVKAMQRDVLEVVMKYCGTLCPPKSTQFTCDSATGGVVLLSVGRVGGLLDRCDVGARTTELRLRLLSLRLSETITSASVCHSVLSLRALCPLMMDVCRVVCFILQIRRSRALRLALRRDVS